MAALTVNGYAVIEGVVIMPRIGAWYVDAVIDVEDATLIQGQVTVASENGALLLQGTAQVSKSGTFVNTGYTRIVPGLGMLTAKVPAKSYSNATLGLVLNDILFACGETLSPLSTPSVLATSLTSWSTFYQPAGQAIASLMRAAPLGTGWRMLQIGQLWVGTETYPVVSSDYQYVVIGAQPHLGRWTLGIEEPYITPGNTLTPGGKISLVEHRILPDSIRTVVWFES